MLRDRLLLLGAAAALLACGGGRAASTAPPGPPIVAPAELRGSIGERCGALIAALDELVACGDSERRRAEARWWRDRLRRETEAAGRDDVDDVDQQATARACDAARGAVDAAVASARQAPGRPASCPTR
jgi:hypothetical protein